MQVEHILTSLGLSPKEQQIYHLVLERGKITPALLSRLSGINRTTVYSVAKELQDKGLLVEDLGGKTLYYLPARESELQKLIKRETEKTETKISHIQQLQEILQSIPESTSYSVPKIRFIDEADLEDYLYEATPRWIESLVQNDPTWWGYQDHSLVERYEGYIDWFWKRAPESICLKLFSNDSAIEQVMSDKGYTRREIRFWDGENSFTSSQWIVGSYVIMVVTHQKPYYLVEIHDSVMAHNMREVFKRLWEK